jgi:hypothetical protein
MERLNVINTLAQHLGKRIDVKDLTEKQKKKLGLDLEK